jgi:hypothetical protein
MDMESTDTLGRIGTLLGADFLVRITENPVAHRKPQWLSSAACWGKQGAYEASVDTTAVRTGMNGGNRWPRSAKISSLGLMYWPMRSF